jgi:hypothetical protein
MSTRADEWIGVADVAAELNLSARAAWEILRRSGVRMLNERAMKRARFRRGDWEAAREQAMRPVPPRAAYVRPAAAPAGEKPKAAPPAPARASKLRGFKV